jgi:hypothetical protein
MSKKYRMIMPTGAVDRKGARDAKPGASHRLLNVSEYRQADTCQENAGHHAFVARYRSP